LFFSPAFFDRQPPEDEFLSAGIAQDKSAWSPARQFKGLRRVSEYPACRFATSMLPPRWHIATG
jgi:hypothetical protein